MNAHERTHLIDVGEAAKRLRVAPVTIRRRIRDGQLEAMRVGARGGIRIPERSLDALVQPVTPPNERTR